MFEINITENGDVVYSRKNQKYIFASSGTTKDFFIKGTASVDELTELLASTMQFVYSSIKANYDIEYSFENLLEDALDKLGNDHEPEDVPTMVKCSDPKDIYKATNLLLNLANSDSQIVGLDFDELKKQLGDEYEENI